MNIDRDQEVDDRRKRFLNHILKWEKLSRIGAFLNIKSDLGLEVDHIVPLQGTNVCGRNDIARMTNLARNMGGSVGISFVTMLLAQRSQVHQTMLASHTSSYDKAFTNAASSISGLFNGMPPGMAMQAAYGRIYGSVQRQAAVLAYIDTIWIFAICCAVMIPFAFLMKKNTGGGPAAVH